MLTTSHSLDASSSRAGSLHANSVKSSPSKFTPSRTENDSSNRLHSDALEPHSYHAYGARSRSAAPLSAPVKPDSKDTHRSGFADRALDPGSAATLSDAVRPATTAPAPMQNQQHQARGDRSSNDTPHPSSLSHYSPHHHSLDRAIDHLSRLLTNYLELGHLQQVVIYRTSELNGSHSACTPHSPDTVLFRKALDRILGSRRVTRDDRTTLLAIARSDFIPTPIERDLMDKIFSHLSIGLIKVVD